MTDLERALACVPEADRWWVDKECADYPQGNAAKLLTACGSALSALEKELDKAREQVALYVQQEMGVAGKCCHESTVALAASQARERALREAVNRMDDALRGLLSDSPDCPLCDHGLLRPRVDGREPVHSDDCPYAEAAAALDHESLARILSARPSDDALNSVCLQVAGAIWALAAPSRELDANAAAALVDRVLGKGGAE